MTLQPVFLTFGNAMLLSQLKLKEKKKDNKYKKKIYTLMFEDT